MCGLPYDLTATLGEEAGEEGGSVKARATLEEGDSLPVKSANQDGLDVDSTAFTFRDKLGTLFVLDRPSNPLISSNLFALSSLRLSTEGFVLDDTEIDLIWMGYKRENIQTQYEYTERKLHLCYIISTIYTYVCTCACM